MARFEMFEAGFGSMGANAQADILDKPRTVAKYANENLEKRMTRRPNKSPEPTPTAVTPRAIEMKMESKRRKAELNEARVAPAVRVAHL